MRIYVDSNVFGSYPTSALWQELWANTVFYRIRIGYYSLVTSDVVEAEIKRAPSIVQSLFSELSTEAEWLPLSDEAGKLRDAYVAAGVVTAKHQRDALHVALATIAGIEVITSWNTRELSKKEEAYSQVNLEEGYGTIEIITPDTLLQRYP